MSNHSGKIPRRFGDKWSRYVDILPEHGVQFEKWIAPWAPADFRDKRVLDAGCGMGQNSFWADKWGAEEVVDFDTDPKTIETTLRNLAGFPNVRVLLKREGLRALEVSGLYDRPADELKHSRQDV